MLPWPSRTPPSSESPRFVIVLRWCGWGAFCRASCGRLLGGCPHAPPRCTVTTTGGADGTGRIWELLHQLHPRWRPTGSPPLGKGSLKPNIPAQMGAGRSWASNRKDSKVGKVVAGVCGVHLPGNAGSKIARHQSEVKLPPSWCGWPLPR